METNVKAVELRELWRRYKDQGDERARERLVVAYSPLVKFIAGRMASGLPSHVEEADLGKRLLLPELGQSLGGAARERGLVARVAQDHVQRLADVALVVDDEDLHRSNRSTGRARDGLSEA